MDKHASINRAFRLVWSTARGTYIVAPETAGGRGRGGRRCEGRIGTSIAAGIAMALGTAWCGGPGSDAFAQVVGAPTTVVPTGGNTRAYVNPNGVPVVNIATPNAAGLSHNRYIHYNVDGKGLVLNNTTRAAGGRSQLAGQVQGNLNLSVPAQVILNQVVAPNRSTLAGFTEVLGRKADVIVANPYGITCSGCGFLNTDRVTLTTGMPVVGGDGALAGFAVSVGDILVNGRGLNASNQQILDLVTRSVRIDGQVNVAATGSVGVAAGPNQWSYATREVTGGVAPSAGAAPTFAIDSTALGGIYGGRIRIIATEAGVGVRMHGDMAASADDFTLSSAGKVDFRAKAAAQRDVVVASSAGGADALALAGAQLSATRDLRLQASAADGGVTLSGGVLVAGANLALSAASLDDSATTSALADNNKRYAGSAATLRTSGAAQLDGVSWGAGGALGADLGSLQVGSRAATLSGGTTVGITTTGDMALDGAAVLSAADLTLAAGGTLRTTAAAGQGVQSSAGAVSMTAAAGLENAGTIAASGGSLTARVDGTLSNTGSIYSRGGLSIADRAGGAGVTVANNAGGAVLADGALSIRATQVGNAGTLQGLGGTTLTAGRLDNSGTFIASDAAGTDAVLDVGTLDNSGILQARRNLAVNLSGTFLSNRGTVIAGADLSIRSQGASLQLDNDAGGTLQAGPAGTLSVGGNAVTLDNAAGASMIADRQALAVQTLQNAGIVQGGSAASTVAVAGTLANTGTLNLATGGMGSGAITANALSNSGTIQSTGAATLDVALAFDNTSSGVLLGDRLQLSSASLTNAGVVQGGSGASSLTISGAASNSGTLSLATSSSGSGTLTAQQLTNSGTLQSAGAATVDVATSITNSSAGRVMADRLSVSAASLSNAGVVQGGTGATTLAVLGTLSNEGVVSLATAAGGSGTINARQINNTGTVQSVGSAALNVQAGLSNTASAKVLAGTSLTVRGTAGVYAVDNQGRMEAGGLLDVKGQGGGNTVTIGVGAAGVMRGQTVALDGQNLTIANGGQVGSSGNMALNAQSLVLGGSSARIVGSTAGGTTSITSAGAFSNPGAIHSGGHLTLSAPSIQNTSTGGISALGNLTLTAGSGNLDNSGALYAGANLTASAAGTLTNAGTLSAQIGTIDSGGAINLNAGTFVNNSTIRAAGAVIVDAGTFKNEVQGGDTRSWVEVTRSTPDDSTEVAAYRVDNWYAFPDDHKNEYFRETWRREQRYASNVAPSFTPQIIGGTAITIRNFTGGASGNRGANISAPTVTLRGSGTFTNDSLALSFEEYQKTWERYTHYMGLNLPGRHIYEYRTKKNESGEQRIGAGVVSSRSAGIYAATLDAAGFGLSVQGPQYGAAPAATSASAPGAGALAPTTTLAGTTAAVINVTPAGATSSITFGGISIALPSNPNGYFVLRPDASASYLVETNPLFAAGSNLYGSAYLAEQFGLKPEELTKRLGDSNYEAHLIRQQLLAQTGRVLLAGYQQEADLLQAMMTRGAAEAKRLGFSWGDAPTNDKLAQLTQDVVWMVKVRVAGQDVLTPVVYLSPQTIAGIQTGTVIAANDVTMRGMASVSNDGGMLFGGRSLSIEAAGDITNRGGTIKGGDVRLTSTEGSLINETLVRTDCADTASFCKSVVGRTAAIEATGSLRLDAGGDIKVKGAQLSAGGSASLNAARAIDLETIVAKEREKTFSATRTGISASHTERVTTTETNRGSSLQVGGDLSLSSGGDMTFRGAAVDVGGNLRADSKGALTIGAVQDRRTVDEKSESHAMFGGGGLFTKENTTVNSVKGTNVGSSFQVKGTGTSSLKAAKDLTIEGSSLAIGGSAAIESTQGNVRVLDGLDEETITTKTTKFTVMQIGETDTGAGPTNREHSQRSYTTARDQGTGGVAIAYADNRDVSRSSVMFERTQTTQVTDTRKQSAASRLQVGGNLTIAAGGSASTQEGLAAGITIRGSDIEAGGDASLQARNVTVLAGENSRTVTTDVKTRSVGVYFDGKSVSSVEAGAQGALVSGRADASFKTENDGAMTIGARNALSNTQANKTTHRASLVKSGGKLDVRAEDEARFVGSKLDAGTDLSITAKNISNLAAVDRDESKTKWSENTEGIYLDARLDSQGYARTRASVSGTPGGATKGLVDKKTDVSIGYRNNQREGTRESGTTNVVANAFIAGRNVTRSATETIVDQATTIDARTGDITQTATTLQEQAVHDKTWQNRSESNKDFRVGLYIGAWNEEIIGGQAGVTGHGMNPGNRPAVDGTVGLRSYNTGGSSDKKSSYERAVTSSYNAKGAIASATTGKTTLVGAGMNAGSGITVTAAEIDYQAAQNKSQRESSRLEWSADGRVGVGIELDVAARKFVPTAVAEAVGKVDTMKITRTNTTAVAGSMTAGGGVSIQATGPTAAGTTSGNARVEGASINARGTVNIGATNGDVVIDAAENTATREGLGGNIALKLRSKATNPTGDLGSQSGGAGFELATGSSWESEQKITRTGANIRSGSGDVTIDAGTKLSAEGVKIDAVAGSVSLKGKSGIALAEATNSETFDKVGHSGFTLGGFTALPGLAVDAADDVKKIEKMAGAFLTGGQTQLAYYAEDIARGTEKSVKKVPGERDPRNWRKTGGSYASDYTVVYENQSSNKGQASTINAGGGAISARIDSGVILSQGTQFTGPAGKIQPIVQGPVKEVGVSDTDAHVVVAVDVNVVKASNPKSSRFSTAARVVDQGLYEAGKRMEVEEITQVGRIQPDQKIAPSPVSAPAAAGLPVPVQAPAVGGEPSAAAVPGAPISSPGAANRAVDSGPAVAFVPVQAPVPPTAPVAAQAPLAPVAALQAPAPVSTPVTAVPVAKPVVKAPVATPPKGPKKPRRRH